jgi:hypothetical protein
MSFLPFSDTCQIWNSQPLPNVANLLPRNLDINKGLVHCVSPSAFSTSTSTTLPMDSLTYRFGSPALPPHTTSKPAASAATILPNDLSDDPSISPLNPDYWYRPSTGSLFTLNDPDQLQQAIDQPWWSQPWVPVVIVVLVIYSVMLSVTLAWFLYNRPMFRRTSAVCFSMSTLKTIANLRLLVAVSLSRLRRARLQP